MTFPWKPNDGGAEGIPRAGAGCTKGMKHMLPMDIDRHGRDGYLTLRIAMAAVFDFFLGGACQCHIEADALEH